ncbi:MAG: nitroreductase family protein [Desulfovibrionaceae bacterium]|jgi:nitroreductase|nr:nitroreductase family protein [Desulfovibrionaceae bacterium]
MDALECILTRRSVRAYTPEPVTDAEIRTLLEAAMAAPSACNQQPWEFVVVRDRETLAKVGTINPHARMAAKAPLGILVCGDATLEKCPGFWVQDCAAAVENLLLAARAMGLGAVWTAVFPVEERIAGYRALFGVPERVTPMAFLVVGHPAEEQKPAERYNPQRVHRDAW